MISREDVVLLLSDLQSQGVDVGDRIRETLLSPSIDINTLKFINDNKQLDVLKFYEKLRKSYNDKKSNLYINIVKSDEKEIKNIMIVMTSLLNQLMIYSQGVEDKAMFLSHSRAMDITKAIAYYLTEYDMQPCAKLLQLVKADLKALESIRHGK